MKSPLITFQQALAIMKETDKNGLPVPFSICFVTADETKQTGGESIQFARAVLTRRGDDHHDAKRIAPARSASNGPRKRDWMYHIRNLDNNQIRQLHLHLIMYINAHPVR
ncbi:hypothetical protein [Fibrella aquatica]|uniref:hypothetical protein n=1 Tax=Fibrella aquatica TaxID=3242487 RepID=UPI00351FE950